MLRVLVLLLLVANGALFWWLQSDPHALQADREPQRIDRQVAPDAIRVLPDLPASGARGAAAPGSATASAASAAAQAASAIDAASDLGTSAGPAASGAAQALAHKTRAAGT